MAQSDLPKLTQAQLGVVLRISENIISCSIPYLSGISNKNFGKVLGTLYNDFMSEVAKGLQEVQAKCVQPPVDIEKIPLDIEELDPAEYGALAAGCGSQVGAYVYASTKSPLSRNLQKPNLDFNE